MAKFLKEVAYHFKSINPIDLAEYCFVFPSRRSCVYFRDHLLEVFKHSNFMLPAIMSIGDFIEDSTDLIIPDDLKLLHSLYICYKKHIGNFNETFEEFHPWGKILLNDFDEIDKYMVNAGKVYQTLLDIKEIDALFEFSEEQKAALRLFWQSTEDHDQDDVRQKFLQIWEHLGSIYNSFISKLTEDGLAFEGMVYKSIVQKTELGHQQFKYKKIVVGGFNALSHSEMRLFKGLLKNYDAQVFWDCDEYYLKDHLQEAGAFLRLYQEKFHEKGNVWVQTNMAATQKEIKIISANRWTGQAQYCGNSLFNQNDLSDTALVLCDEKMLDPLLNILPKTLGDINITMGYSIRNSPLYQLIRTLHRLQKNKRKHNHEISFYYKDVLHLLHNPILAPIIKGLKNAEIEVSIKKENLIIVAHSLLQQLSFDIKAKEELLFQDINSIEAFKNHQLHLLSAIRNHIFSEDPFNNQIDVCDAIINKINVLFTLIEEHQLVENLSDYNSLLTQELQSMKIPFPNTGTKSLQIMGFLESRTLDFKHLYILSANEGHLPAKQSNNTFIPYNIRRAFDLPTFEQHDNIYAYHFYRLIQRSQDVHLIFDNVISQSQKEKSRFLQQLQTEYKNEIEEIIIQQPIQQTGKNQPLTINKNDRIIDKLNRFLTGEKQLSATAIITYLTCPVQFYFQYILDLYETENDVDEEIDQALFGTLFHTTMEGFYTSYLEQDIPSVLKSIDSKNLSVDLEPLIKNAFVENKLGSHYGLLQGRNYLIKNVIKRLCIRLIGKDKNLEPFRITKLEHKVDNYPLKLDDSRMVYLKGIIDRIDQLNHDKPTYRIVDYKTGQVKISNMYFHNNLMDDDTYVDRYFSTNYKQGFQGYFYALLFQSLHPEADLKVGFYSTKNLSNGILYLREGEVISKEILAIFEDRLKTVIEEILNPDIPFVQTEKNGTYRYSPYKDLVNHND